MKNLLFVVLLGNTYKNDRELVIGWEILLNPVIKKIV